MKRALGFAALIAVACVLCSSAAFASSTSYDATYWTQQFGSDVSFAIPGSSFATPYDSGSGGYFWNDRIFAGHELTGEFFSMMGQYYVIWSQDGSDSTTATFTNADDARAYLDRKFVNLVAGNGGAASATGNTTPIAPVHFAGLLTSQFVLAPPIWSRNLWDSQGKFKKPPNVFATQENALAAQPADTASRSIYDNSAFSGLRYGHRWYDDSEAQNNQYGMTLRGGLQWDRVTLDVMMPLDRVDFNEDYDFLDFSRLGIILTPRFYLLTQEEKPIDLYFGLSMAYFHTWMDEGEVDPDHASIGPMLGFQKDFQKCALSAGYVFQRGFNLDGDNEVNGEEEVDVHKIAATVGVPIGDRWAVNLGAIYSHTAHLPDSMDQDFVTMSLGANYVLKDSWTLDVTLMRDFCYEDADNIEIHIGAVWTF